MAEPQHGEERAVDTASREILNDVRGIVMPSANTDVYPRMCQYVAEKHRVEVEFIKKIVGELKEGAR